MKQVISDRASGILLHISSLPAPYGIGDLGSALHFVDFLVDSGQSCWQFLPLGPTNSVFGNSPYMSFSAFAGNPLFISPDLLHEDGLISAEELASGYGFSEYLVEFEKVIKWKRQLFAKAWGRFCSQSNTSDFEQFCEKNDWLADYTLFMALKEKYSQLPWYEWPEDVSSADKNSLLVASMELADSVEYYKFEQYLFFRQWRKVQDHARWKGVLLIGDLPIYIGMDSVDVWTHQDIFELNRRSRLPVRVAGVPPDYFSKTGQRWGNPLYRWNTRTAVVKNNLYNWWEQRFSAIFSFVDIIRIDHFRGFESYWSIPAADKTAENGTWKRGPGLSFFQEMERRLGTLPVIAEDLGVITPAVEELRDTLGYPGMKILQFAFDGSVENPYLPFNYNENCVVYTGTHDNDTVVGWYLDPNVSESAKKDLKKAANKEGVNVHAVHQDFIYLALSSTAVLSVLPMQDILGFGSDCRMNTPGTAEGNWIWRCAPRYFSDDIAMWLREQTRFFGRLRQVRENEKTQPVELTVS